MKETIQGEELENVDHLQLLKLGTKYKKVSHKITGALGFVQGCLRPSFPSKIKLEQNYITFKKIQCPGLQAKFKK